MTDIFFKRLCTRANLFAAWRHVKARALSSPSREIRDAAEDFDVHAFRNLQSIQSRLCAETFSFPPAEGVLKDKVKRERQGKLPRPIVISDIRARVVQRALLQCMQPDQDDELYGHVGRIRDVNASKVNFGGTPYGGVPRAIYRVKTLMSSGHSIFYKSDIGSFFTKVPHGIVLDFLRSELQDEKFIRVFQDGLDVQLKNADCLQEYLDLFPDNEFGVAQGSSLSAFAGNIFLHEVDEAFQGLEGVALVRYIDDVLLLGTSNELVQWAKSKLRRDLNSKGLSLYDPASAPDKASEGHVRSGFDYLGCALRPGQVEPSKKARASLLKKVDDEIHAAKINIEKFQIDASLKRNRQPTFAQTVSNVDNIVRGWSNSFRFVNSRLVFVQIDKQIIRKAFEFRDWLGRLQSQTETQSARMLGLFQANDVEYKPLEEFIVRPIKQKARRYGNQKLPVAILGDRPGQQAPA